MTVLSIKSLYATIEQQQRVIKQAHEDVAKLTTERDELLEFVEEVRRNGDARLASMAIATINKVLGNE